MNSSATLSHFTASEIAQLIKSARRVLKHPGLHLLVAPATQAKGRILVITSKKIANAPARNKIRRQLKALFYEEKLFEYGYDCIVIIKKDGLSLSYADLKTLLTNTLNDHAHASS